MKLHFHDAIAAPKSIHYLMIYTIRGAAGASTKTYQGLKLLFRQRHEMHGVYLGKIVKWGYTP